MDSRKSWFDFAARLLFFAAAPYQLVRVAALFPVTGAIVQIALALAVLVLGEAARTSIESRRWLRPLARSQLAFEAYYRAHPPRPFLYYVFFPVLFPYWVTRRDNRNEFWLYKGYTLVSFALMAASLVWQYARAYPPELGFAAFWPMALGTLAVEAVVVVMVLMPIATTIVHYHLAHRRLPIAALLVAATLSLGFSVARLAQRRDPVVSFAARSRAHLRALARPAAAEAAARKALVEAWRYLPREKNDVDSDGKVEGLPLEKARDALGAFYKPDEAIAFDLWLARAAQRSIIVVYSPGRRSRPPVWLAMRKDGTRTHDVADLPAGAFRAMRLAAD